MKIMVLNDLKEKIKQIIFDEGAKLVGVGSQERLKDAPSSGNMEYCLPGAQSCIIWVYPNPIEALENYFSKKERMSIKKAQQIGYAGAWRTANKISRFIEDHTEFEAFPVIPNAKYRPREELPEYIKGDIRYPDFSLRYGGVAAGLGHLGWSGNLVTKEYGGSIYLGGVLTTAPLEPDPMAKENHCNRCKICFKACTTGYFSENEEEDMQPVMIGGSKETYAKRGTFSQCGIGCAGWYGLSEDGQWSTWTPGHLSLKKFTEKDWQNRDFLRNLYKRILADEDAPENIRKFNQVIARSFGKVAAFENVGLRPFTDTNPRCGNCNFICVADPKKRKELYTMLINSGKVYIDKEGREFVKKFDENGKGVTYYPLNEKEFFTEEEFSEIDEIRKF
jgi:epoxyqueuosine reductase